MQFGARGFRERQANYSLSSPSLIFLICQILRSPSYDMAAKNGLVMPAARTDQVDEIRVADLVELD